MGPPQHFLRSTGRFALAATFASSFLSRAMRESPAASAPGLPALNALSRRTMSLICAREATWRTAGGMILRDLSVLPTSMSQSLISASESEPESFMTWSAPYS